MSKAKQVKLQFDEVIAPLTPCAIASAVTPDAVPCRGRRWRLLLHVTVAGTLHERHAPVVCDAHGPALAFQQVGELLLADELRRAAGVAGRVQ